MTLAVGQQAPDFVLRDQHGQSVSLSSFRGQPVLLVFYPFAFSGVCSGELRALRDQWSELASADVELLAVSCDPVYSLRVFADSENFAFPLLSDFWPHGEVARRYGVFDEAKGSPLRSSYVVDPAGDVRWGVHNAMPEGRDLDEHLKQLQALV